MLTGIFNSFANIFGRSGNTEKDGHRAYIDNFFANHMYTITDHLSDIKTTNGYLSKEDIDHAKRHASEYYSLAASEFIDTRFNWR